MKLKIFYCENGEYSTEHEICRVHNRLLDFRGDKLEVKLILDPEVKGHSGNKFNVMFLDRDKGLNDDDRKYFASTNWLKGFRLRWMYGRYEIQKATTIVNICLLVAGWGLGFITPSLIETLSHKSASSDPKSTKTQPTMENEPAKNPDSLFLPTVKENEKE